MWLSGSLGWKMRFQRQSLWRKSLRRVNRYYTTDLGDKDLSTSAEQPEGVQRWMKESGEIVLWRWKSDSFKERERWWRMKFYFRNVCCIIFMLSRTMWPHRHTVMRTCGPHKTHTDLCGGGLLGWSCFALYQSLQLKCEH